MSGLEGTTDGTGTLLRPAKVPQVYSVPGKTREYRIPLSITVNSIFIRSLRSAEEQRRCMQRNRIARLNHQINPQCQNVIRLNIPLDLIIPKNVESSAVEHENTSPDFVDPLALVNYGPNAYPPNAYPPNTYPPNAYQPNAYPSNAYPPNAYPPNSPNTYPNGPNAYLNANSRMPQDLYRTNYAVGDPIRARRVKRSNPLFMD